MLRKTQTLALTLLAITGFLGFMPGAGAASPNACFTVNPQAGTTATVFAVDASCSTHSTTPTLLLEVRWDWEDDGTYDTTWTTTKTDTIQYTTNGLKRIRLEVRDPFSTDTASTTQTVAVGPGVYQPAWGFIGIDVPASGTVNVVETYTSSGWNCSTTQGFSGVMVSCIAPPPPQGFAGWSCNAIAISAFATSIGSSVNGEIGCEDSFSSTATGSTGDVVGPNGSGYGSSPGMIEVVRIWCASGPIFGQTAAQPPYRVNCGDP